MFDLIPLFLCLLFLVLFNRLSKNYAREIKFLKVMIHGLQHEVDLLKPPTRFIAEDVAKAYEKGAKLAVYPEKDFTVGLINSASGENPVELPEGAEKIHGIIVPSHPKEIGDD